MLGIAIAVLAILANIISKTCFGGEYLGEMTVTSVFVPTIISMCIKLKKYMK